MHVKKRRLLSLIALLSVFTLVGAACGDDEDTTGTASGETEDAEFSCPEGSGLESNGSINVSGSSTVAPITTQAKDCFAEAGGTSNITIDNPGTGDGFKLFCAGETDISDASRPIKSAEADTCKAAGIEFIEIKVGFDGMAVMTSPANETVECLNFADLYAIMGPESQGFDNWQDATDIAAALGSTTAFPDLSLSITAPGEESGTYDSFVEIALAGIAEDRGKEDTTRPDYSSQANDDAIIQGIAGADGSFGWVGFAFADQAGSGVKSLEIAEEPGGECVAPSSETIASGEYPLSRGLYIYVNQAKAESNEAIVSFVDYYLEHLDAIVEAADYVPLPADQAGESSSRWEARTTGTAES